jgi:hypothetical protein
MSDQAGSLPYLQLVMLSYQTCEELAGSDAVQAALARVAASEAGILSMRLSSLVRFDRLAAVRGTRQVLSSGHIPRSALTVRLADNSADRGLGVQRALEDIVAPDASFAGENHVVYRQHDETPGTVRKIGFVWRQPGSSRDEFFHHWHDIHGPMVIEHGPLFFSYSQAKTIRPAEEGCDGIVEQLYDSEELCVEHDRLLDDAKPQVLADIGNFVKESQLFLASTMLEF